MSLSRSLSVAALAAVAAALLPALPAEAARNSVFGARSLERGDRGRDVRVLQDFLSRAGVGTDVDGRFGHGTRARLKDWERRKRTAYRSAKAANADTSSLFRVRVDGRLSPNEAKVLRADVEAAEAGRTPAGSQPGTDAPDAAANGAKATLASDGTAVAPASAPEAVKRLIAAANEIHSKPYRYGGGHSAPPNRDSGYDCSGSMSYAMQGAGLLRDALDSSGFARFGESGRGEWVTIYANAGHSYMVIAGLRFDTSGRKDANSRWQERERSSSGYTVRHPRGL